MARRFIPDDYSPGLELLKDLTDPRNYATAASNVIDGLVKGISFGYIDPSRDSVTNPLTGEVTRDSTLSKIAGMPGDIFRLLGGGGTLEDDINRSKFAQTFGELMGSVAPITGISKAVAAPLKIIGAGRGTAALLGEQALTGAAFGFARNPSEDATTMGIPLPGDEVEVDQDGTILDRRLKNAASDALLFPALTGLGIGAAGILKAMGRAKGIKPKPPELAGRTEVDEAIAILNEAPPPARNFTVDAPISGQEVSRGLDEVMTLPAESRQQAMKELFPHLNNKSIRRMIDAREAQPPSLRGKPGADINPNEVKTDLRKVDTANQTEELIARSQRLDEVANPNKRADVANTVSEMVRVHDSSLKVGEYETAKLVNKMRSDLSETQLNKLTYLIEKTGDPTTGLTYEQVLAQATPEMKKYAGLVRKRFDKLHKVIQDSPYINSVGFIEDYLPHFYNVSKREARKIANQRSWNRKFFRENRNAFDTIDQAMREGGHTNITTNVADMLQAYEGSMNRVMANNKMLSALKNATDEVGRPLRVTLKDASGKSGEFADYVKVNHPSLQDSLFHPDAKPMLEVLLGSPFDGGFARGMTTLNAFMKKAALSFSFFHHIALTESAVGALGVKAPKIIAKTLREALKGKGNLAKYYESIMTREMFESGLQIGALTDVQRGIVRQGLKSIEQSASKIAGVNKAVRGFRKFNDKWDSVLWDYYHTGLKANAFTELLENAVRKNPHISRKVLAKEIATFVNDTFGGQSWTQLMRTPKWRQAAHWTLLAPDWTLSVARQAASLARGTISKESAKAFKFGEIADLLGLTKAATAEGQAAQKVIRGQALKFWAQSALALFTFGNLMNYAFTKYKDGEGKFMWENDPGHGLDIERPYSDENGRRVYIRMGKQFREAFKWFVEPTKQLGSKLSPGLHLAVEQITGSSTTGFPTKFKDLPFLESLDERAVSLASKVVPFSVRGNNFMMALPTATGMTTYEAKKRLSGAVKDGDMREIERILSAAKGNNLDVKELLNYANRSAKTRKSVIQEDLKSMLLGPQ